MISAGLYPQGYGYVLAAAASTGFLTVYQSMVVSGARKAAKIAYPNAYASAEQAARDPLANKFNCAVRAHANCLEELPWFLFALLFTGLEYPTLAAVSGALWVSGESESEEGLDATQSTEASRECRVAYTIGYASGNPKGRLPGSLIFHIGSLGLLLGSTYSAYQVIMAQL
ncbi:hypothetical protein P7C70_g6936, partial [Phenoliferia sp. Uapishka_3]